MITNRARLLVICLCKVALTLLIWLQVKKVVECQETFWVYFEITMVKISKLTPTRFSLIFNQILSLTTVVNIYRWRICFNHSCNQTSINNRTYKIKDKNNKWDKPKNKLSMTKCASESNPHWFNANSFKNSMTKRRKSKKLNTSSCLTKLLSKTNKKNKMPSSVRKSSKMRNNV